MSEFFDHVARDATDKTAMGASSAPWMVRVVHSAVKGRARFEVKGLYRSEPVRLGIESELPGNAGIKEASASVLTGRLLVFFDPARDVEEIRILVEQLLTRHVFSASALSAPKVYPRPLRAVASFRPNPPSQTFPASPQEENDWQALPDNAVLEALETSRESGLSQASAQRKLGHFGPNRLPQTPPRPGLRIFLGQFKSLPVALLGVSAVLSAATGGLVDAVVILGVVLVNAGTGYVAESQAERTINALGEIGQPNAMVIREAQLREVEAEVLVPGDILVLTPGSRVAADARLLESRNLMADESALTGESLPVLKTAEPLDRLHAPLGERLNMVYMGAVITGGSGLAVVVATGPRTEIGAIQELVGETRPPETPMQRQLGTLGNQMALLSISICGMMFLIGLARGYSRLQMLKASISLAVAAMPEGLPTVATTTLALGIRDMRRHRVLVRHLDAVEALGAMQVICLDKTGTLTLNRMSVVAVHSGGRRLTLVDGAFYDAGVSINPCSIGELLRLMHVAVLCNETELNGDASNYMLKGSATETALVHFALAAGVEVGALRRQYRRVQVEYRAEKQNYMRTLHVMEEGGKIAAVKGSPAEVLEMCSWWIKDGVRLPLTETDRTAILIENDRMAGEALRVLGFAYAELAKADQSTAEELTWLGMTGMADPVRQGVKELISLFHQAGISTVMITGDQSATAYAIGKELGLSGSEELNILDSSRLEQLDPDVLTGLVQKVNIFSRVSPANKLQIMQALQRAGKVAGMTGDGINDGPALKAADIGVAMGGTGTDVARDVADVVLEDDDLRTMIMAVSEGRTTYNNIRKSVHFLTATNLSEIMLMLASIGSGLGTPLTTMQLLWINLLTDIFPALALAVEPPEPDVLRRPPRDPGELIVRSSDFKRYGLESLTITAASMASYGYAIARYGAGPRAGTIAFMTLTMAQLMHAYSCRSDRNRIVSREPLRPNSYLNLALGGTVVLQLASVAVPGLRSLLGNTLPGPIDMAVIGAGSTLSFMMNEATKGTKGTTKGTKATKGLAVEGKRRQGLAPQSGRGV